MIKVYNRRTKEYEIEKVPGGRIINHLYGNITGKIGLEALIKRKLYSVLVGRICDSSFSRYKIKSFIDKYKIDMRECEQSLEKFKNFNEFFARKLKAEARPFDLRPHMLLSPGDGRLQAWQDIRADKMVQVKGSYYSLADLLLDEELAGQYDGGTCILLRLCPTDYHRFHFIDEGICTPAKRIKGFYYSVNPSALKSIPELFCRNKREYSIFHSDNFGDVLYVEVGATFVGSIVQTYAPNERVKRGQEKGYFKFGGSTLILLLKKGFSIIDDDILNVTESGYETKVYAGETIGRSLLVPDRSGAGN